MIEFIDIWLGLACWVLILWQVFSSKTSTNRIYTTLCKIVFLVYLVSLILFYLNYDDTIFLMKHFFFLAIMTSFHLAMTFSEQEKKKSRNRAIVVCVLSLLSSVMFFR